MEFITDSEMEQNDYLLNLRIRRERDAILDRRKKVQEDSAAVGICIKIVANRKLIGKESEPVFPVRRDDWQIAARIFDTRRRLVKG